MLYLGYSVGYILDIVYDLFWLYSRMYFGYSEGFILAIV